MTVLWLSYLATPSISSDDWFALSLTCPKIHQKLFSSNLSHLKKINKLKKKIRLSMLIASSAARWLHSAFLNFYFFKKVDWKLTSCASRVSHVINFAIAFGKIETKILLTSHRQSLYPFETYTECCLFFPDVKVVGVRPEANLETEMRSSSILLRIILLVFRSLL